MSFGKWAYEKLGWDDEKLTNRQKLLRYIREQKLTTNVDGIEINPKKFKLFEENEEGGDDVDDETYRILTDYGYGPQSFGVTGYIFVIALIISIILLLIYAFVDGLGDVGNTIVLIGLILCSAVTLVSGGLNFLTAYKNSKIYPEAIELYKNNLPDDPKGIAGLMDLIVLADKDYKAIKEFGVMRKDANTTANMNKLRREFENEKNKSV